MSELSAFHHVALSVSDLEVSVAWYSRVLGFKELFREAGGTRRACVMGFENGASSVGFVEHGDRTGDLFDPARIGLDHFAFAVATREDLDEWATRLSDAGVDHSGAIDVPPGAILNFKDPDGVALALFWDRPA